MREWELECALDASAAAPLFVQLVQAIAAAVRAGRLPPGARLPGSRSLARTLRVHRNTVLAAFAELAAEGVVEARPGGGTFVARQLHDALPPEVAQLRPRARAAKSAGFALPPLEPPALASTEPKGALALSRAAPDPRLLPVAELARAYRRVLLRAGKSLLFYGDPQGHARLREALAQMLCTTRGLACAREGLLITRGSQMAIDLCARLLLKPGDAVAVEALGHPQVWSALRRSGAELLPVPVDADGLSLDALERLSARRKLRAVYLTPHHQFPTTAVLSPARRARLLALARREQIAILEDDYDHEFHYDEPPVLPLASAATSNVIYLGTLSKILAPGLRLGFACATPDVIARLVSLRASADLQGDQATECAVAELFEEGEVQRHVRRVREVYRARRDALAAALNLYLSDSFDAELPRGGLALWARARPHVDLEAFAAASLARGVALRTARAYSLLEPPHALRLAFSLHDERELQAAARAMAAALSELDRRRPASS